MDIAIYPVFFTSLPNNRRATQNHQTRRDSIFWPQLFVVANYGASDGHLLKGGGL